MTVSVLPMLALITCFAAFVQSVSGFGFSLIAVPLLMILLGPLEAVVTATLLSALLTLSAAAVLRRDILWLRISSISLASIIGIPLGLLVADVIPVRVLAIFISILVIVVSVHYALSRRIPRTVQSKHIVAGVLSGALLASTGLNGPPLILSFQRMQLGAEQSRANLQAAFAFQDLIAIIGFASVGRLELSDLTYVFVLLPLLVIGWAFGACVFRRLTSLTFRYVTLGLLFTTGVFAIVQQLIGMQSLR